MKFTELPLSKALIDNLDENNFTECTEVQALALPKLLDNKNVMVQAQTGTGKTAAFLIPLIEKLSKEEPKKLATGLIISPTRELASQIMEDAEILGTEALNIKGALLFGGANIQAQQKTLPHARFIVATPGRLLDFCTQNKQLLSSIHYFVLDEADRLFDMGFYPEIKKVIALLPPPKDRQSMLFSATLSTKVKNMAKQDFDNPVALEVPTTTLAVDKIKQEAVYLTYKEKFSLTLGLLKRMDASEMAVVFTNTKHHCETIALRLMYNGVNCDYITGDLPQNRRQKVIARIKEGTLNVLIATDVAARGLHIHNLALVINYDLPDDPQSYIHRIGRTGRAGKNGEAISLVCDKLAYNLEGIESLLKHRIPAIEEDYRDLLAEDESKDVPIRQLAKSANRVVRTEHREPRNSSSRRGASDGRRRQGQGSKDLKRRPNEHAKRSSTSYSKHPRKDRESEFSVDESNTRGDRNDKPYKKYDSQSNKYGSQNNRNGNRANTTQAKSKRPNIVSTEDFNRALDKSARGGAKATDVQARPSTQDAPKQDKKKPGLFGIFNRLIKKQDSSNSANKSRNTDTATKQQSQNRQEEKRDRGQDSRPSSQRNASNKNRQGGYNKNRQSEGTSREFSSNSGKRSSNNSGGKSHRKGSGNSAGNFSDGASDRRSNSGKNNTRSGGSGYSHSRFSSPNNSSKTN